MTHPQDASLANDEKNEVRSPEMPETMFIYDFNGKYRCHTDSAMQDENDTEYSRISAADLRALREALSAMASAHDHLVYVHDLPDHHARETYEPEILSARAALK